MGRVAGGPGTGPGLSLLLFGAPWTGGRGSLLPPGDLPQPSCLSSPSLTSSGHTGPLDVPPVADGPTPGLSTSVLPLRRAPPRRAAGVWRFQPPALVRSWGGVRAGLHKRRLQGARSLLTNLQEWVRSDGSKSVQRFSLHRAAAGEMQKRWAGRLRPGLLVVFVCVYLFNYLSLSTSYTS